MVIDDDLSLREFMETLLRNSGHQVTLAENGQAGLELALAEDYDLIISDIRMPQLSGLEVLTSLRTSKQTTFLLISAYANEETAVEAMRRGAYDFIPKPFKPADLLAVVDSALAHRNVDIERQALADMVSSNQRFSGLVGASPAMLPVYELIKRAAQTSTSILITGESGTGKELVARAVHLNSSRAEKSFVAINCGGMPEQLVESELFGYKKGAFTGANADKQGLMSTADGGTLFLDELAELTLPMQVKLLRVVQERTFRPVGGNAELTADVRFIAATNKNLESEIIAGRFREDLYYRLNVINIRIPPLRERPMDIPLLAHYFLEKYSLQQSKDVRKLSTYALDILSRYHFPGNVRELENIIERSVALEQSNIILPESLRLADFKRESSTFNPPFAGPPQPPFAGAAGPLSAAPPPLNGWRPGGPPAPPETAALADPAASEAAFQLPPGGLDDLLTSLEGHYLFNSLISASGTRGRAASLLRISPWRLRMRLVAFSLSDLNPMELASIPRDRYPRPALPEELAPEWNGSEIDLDEILHAVERRFIRLALEKSGDNKTEAATSLGLSRRSFQHRIERTNYEQEMTKLAARTNG
ncbi:MAG: sigma 54-interacting transcriptional regulator [Deltaproteobacteria bacterium]|nr:sigma 54-interacting transcriptional regulator [Deltaproteobacteria bacterium]